jgi:hypothetical protein
MLELLLIIWLSIGFIVSLSTFFITLYETDYLVVTMEDVFALLVHITSGPLYILYMLLERYISMDDIELYVHHRLR